MNILHLIERYWPARGGAERYMEEVSSRLAADGHKVTVAASDAHDFELLFTPKRRRLPEREITHDGVRVLRFPVRHLPGAPLTYSAWRRGLWILSTLRPLPAGLASYLARFTPWVPGLYRWLSSTDQAFDLVTGVNVCFESLPLQGQRFAQRRHIPFVMIPLTHLGAGPRPGRDRVGSFYTMRHQLGLVQGSDAVIVQTQTERSFYEAHGVPRHRTRVIGPGVNPAQILGGDGQRFRKRHGLQGPLVAYVGALTHDKGAIPLAEAMRHLWRSGKQVEVALAGAVLTPFRHYARTLPAQDRERLHVLGAIEEQEKRDLLAAADMLVMTSRTDSFGIVYLESWLYGKPVIGARAWGMDDVISDGEDGLLVPFGDIPALAAAIADLLDHPERKVALGEQGRAKVHREHTWETKYAAIRRLYEQLCT
jgi:glycosyltransferase involved in cell wall biosynthesis